MEVGPLRTGSVVLTFLADEQVVLQRGFVFLFEHAVKVVCDVVELSGPVEEDIMLGLSIVPLCPKLKLIPSSNLSFLPSQCNRGHEASLLLAAEFSPADIVLIAALI